MNKSIIGITLIMLSGMVSAKPLYLECMEPSKDKRSSFSVTLDEDTRKITHKYNGPVMFNANGFFSANEISYKNVDEFDDTEIYTINRVDLSYTMSHSMGSKVVFTQSGTCEVISTKNRKI